eukprot:5223174-Ditylum_brightwellii.AAC.1
MGYALTVVATFCKDDETASGTDVVVLVNVAVVAMGKVGPEGGDIGADTTATTGGAICVGTKMEGDIVVITPTPSPCILLTEPK